MTAGGCISDSDCPVGESCQLGTATTMGNCTTAGLCATDADCQNCPAVGCCEFDADAPKASVVIGQDDLYGGAGCNFDSTFQTYPERAPAHADSLCMWRPGDPSPGEVNGGAWLSIDSDGDLYVPDRLNNRIVRFGQPLTFPRPEGGDRRSYYETVSRAMMAAIEALQEGKGRPAGESSGITCGRSRQPLKYIHGRNGQHGNG